VKKNMKIINSKPSTVQVTTRASGVSFLSLLAILFIALKLTNYIAWDWIWVLAPLWFPAAVVVMLILICAVLATIVAVVENLRTSPRIA